MTGEAKRRRLAAGDLKDPDEEPISARVVETCRIGRGADCCRFLTFRNGFHCGKHDEQLASQIEARRPVMVAQGDNCEGFPLEVIL
ncbi:hypothetical protein NKJ06_21170 [Mesorhizobium sp. M0293]|uniref:hypothetical protein n=1 Tax=Mesorhizobium sp. M0293 TaxID=2956930 RepID=UPI00333D4B09